MPLTEAFVRLNALHVIRSLLSELPYEPICEFILERNPMSAIHVTEGKCIFRDQDNSEIKIGS